MNCNARSTWEKAEDGRGEDRQCRLQASRKRPQEKKSDSDREEQKRKFLFVHGAPMWIPTEKGGRLTQEKGKREHERRGGREIVLIHGLIAVAGERDVFTARYGKKEWELGGPGKVPSPGRREGILLPAGRGELELRRSKNVE